MLLRSREKAIDGIHGLLKLLDEFEMLLVAPGVAETEQLTVHDGHAVLQIVAKALEVIGEPSQFAGIDNSLAHDGTSPKKC
jgi:hypothetical protein